jgi:hypothetical protein
LKTVNIITNIANGAGLQRDAELFGHLLESLGHRYQLIAYDRPYEGLNYPADISVFMEVMVPGMLNWASQNWLMPNSEWWNGYQGNTSLSRINKVLCKTRDCYNIWNRKLPGRCEYTGFESYDFSNNTLLADKQLNFLHLAGNSGTKNTEAVVDAWRQYKIPYNVEIVIRSISYIPRTLGVPNVTYHQRLPDEYVKMALNLRWFHLMPSQYEGYGHSIHEALACGGIVLTTDAPPMNEFAGVPKNLMIPSTGTFQKEFATCHYVSPEGVAEAVHKAAKLSFEDRCHLSVLARRGYEEERAFFRQKIRELFSCG